MTKARDLANAGTALTTVSATELGYLDGVTSAVQTQIDTKAPTSTTTTLTGTQTLTNKTLTSPTINTAQSNDGTYRGAKETVHGIGSAFASGYTYNVSSGTLQWLSTDATGSGALNVRYALGTSLDSVMAVGSSITIVLGINNGTTPYYPSSFTIDGSAPTSLRWSGGTAPTAGNASSVDWYQYTIIKVSSATFYVWASQSKYA